MSVKGLSVVGAIALAFGVGHWLGRESVVQAQSGNRVFELRMYTAAPGKLPEVHDMFRKYAAPIFKRHGMTNVGYWAPTDDPASKDQFIYLLAHESRAAAEKSWAAFRVDKEWRAAREKIDANGRIVAKTEGIFMEPLDFSPMK